MFNKRTEDPFVYRAGEEIFVYNNFSFFHCKNLLWLYNVLSTCIVCTVYDCNRTWEEYQMFLSEVIDFFPVSGMLFVEDTRGG